MNSQKKHKDPGAAFAALFLHVAYNLKRVISIMGTQEFVKAMQA